MLLTYAPQVLVQAAQQRPEIIAQLIVTKPDVLRQVALLYPQLVVELARINPEAVIVAIREHTDLVAKAIELRPEILVQLATVAPHVVQVFVQVAPGLVREIAQRRPEFVQLLVQASSWMTPTPAMAPMGPLAPAAFGRTPAPTAMPSTQPFTGSTIAPFAQLTGGFSPLAAGMPAMPYTPGYGSSYGFGQGYGYGQPAGMSWNWSAPFGTWTNGASFSPLASELAGLADLPTSKKAKANAR
jgi:hypothetical protein